MKMVDIQSKEAIDQMSEDLKVQPAAALPRRLKDDIQPVYSINNQRVVNMAATLVRTTTANGALLLQTPTGKDFYLTGASIQNVSNATANNVNILIGVTLPTGESLNVVALGKLTTTAFSDHVAYEFNTPIRLQRGSAITVTNAFTVGASSTVFSVRGYTVDPQ